MSDFFSRLIERTMGYAETVQPLVAPEYSSVFSQKSGPDYQTDNFAEIEKHKESNTIINSVRNLSFPLVGNPSFDLMKKDAGPAYRTGRQAGMTTTDDTLKNKTSVNNLLKKDIKENFHSTEINISDKQDFESLTKEEDIRLIAPQNSLLEGNSQKILSDADPLTDIKSSDFDFSKDVKTIGININGKVIKGDKNKQEHLLPISVKSNFVFERTVDNRIGNSNINNDHNRFKANHEAPTVKVNIGRVEVKAIIQQKTKQPHTLKHEPKLSLDEYLKQRKSGKR